MKKILSFLLIFVLLFGVVACTEPSTSEEGNQTETTTNENTEAEEKNDPPAHTHTWVNATCVAPKTCACGATEGEVLGHSWADATCIAPKTCSVCGEVEGEALGHTWTSADCTTPKTCSTCGVSVGEALGHVWTDATCTTPKTCTTCGEVEGEALGHAWTDATCTTPKTCATCGEVEGEALGHTYGEWVVTLEPTMTHTGLQVKECSACGAKLQKKLPALHAHEATEATCTAPSICLLCGIELEKALGHDMKKATCTESASCRREGCGYIAEALGHAWLEATCEAPKTCVLCGTTQGNALGHTWVDATCTTPKTCSVCSAIQGAALGHDMSGEATCTESASCRRKGCNYTEEAFGHSYGAWTITTVPTDGNLWVRTRICPVCGGSETDATPAELNVPAKAPAPIYPEQPTSGGTKITLVSAGKAQYTLVSSDPEYDDLTRSLSVKLREQLGVTFNYKLSAQQNSVSGKKIIIGKNPKTLLSNPLQLSYLGLLCSSTGSSIHITGYIEETVVAAVNRFAAIDLTPYITTGTDGKKLVSVPTGAMTFVANPTNYVNPNPTLFGVPLSDYTVIVPKTMSATENFCIKQLIDEIGRYSGIYLSTKTEDKATGVHEIVFSNTVRLADTDYAIKSEGESLYIPFPHYRLAQKMRNALHTLYLSNVNDVIDLKVTPPEDLTKRVEKSEDTDVRIMTSNIVCAADANGIKDIQKPYGILWQERIAIVTREIMTYLPDFVGMQEIQNGTVNGIPADMFTEILNNVSSKYAFVTYDGMNPSAYWNPILYRHTIWQIEAKDVLYPGDFDNAMHRWQWALFSKIDDPTQKYIVLNLHNPTRSGNLPGQLAAADIVNAKILELKELYPNVPIILTGDFNTEFDTETYQRTVANTDVRCAYTQTDDCNDLGDLTGKETPTGEDNVIDHIMVSTDLLNVIACRKVNDDYMRLTSDHRPMFADLSLKKDLTTVTP